MKCLIWINFRTVRRRNAATAATGFSVRSPAERRSVRTKTRHRIPIRPDAYRMRLRIRLSVSGRTRR